MRSLNLLSLLLAFSLPLILGNTSLHAATFYLSTDGSNSNDGLSPATAWKSLSKLQSELFSMGGGDTILFRRGDVFKGKLEVYNSGTASQHIVFATYGGGPKPVIDGSRNISSWVNEGANIWSYSLPASWPDPEVLFIDGQWQDIGHWPNMDEGTDGYYTIDSHVGDSEITSSDLSGSPDFTGGEFVSRTQNWVMDRLPIIAQAGSSISLGPGASYDPRDGYGFFIQHHPATLDRDGEWAFEKSSRKVYLYWPSSPAVLDIAVAVEPFGVQLFDLQHISMRDLTFRHSAGPAIKLDLVDDLLIQSVEIEESGREGIYGVEATNVKLIDNKISECANNAITLKFNSSNCTIRSNQVSHCGLRAGTGPSGVNQYTGIFAEGDGMLFQKNIIDEVGYNGLRFEGNNVTVEDNLIRRHGSLLDDCAGIYTWSDGTVYSNRVVRSNIVLEGRGNGEGTDAPDYGFAVGVYMDDRSSNVVIEKNTLAHNSSAGLYIHNANNITARENILFNNEEQLLIIHDSISPDDPVRNCVITRNVMVAKTADQLALSMISIRSDFDSIGILDSNVYARPIKAEGLIRTRESYSGFNTLFYDLDSWKASFPFDVASSGAPIDLPFYSIDAYLSGELQVNGNFDTDIADWYCYSPYGSCNLSWSGSGGWDGGAAVHNFTSFPLDEYALLTTASGMGPVSAGDWIEVNLTAASNKPNTSMVIVVRRNIPPYDDLTAEQNFSINTTPEGVSALFQVDATASNARVDLRLFASDSSDIIFDQLSVRKIQPLFTDPNQHMAFFLNHKNTARNLPIPFPVFDPFGNLETGSVLIPPISSTVLFRPATTAMIAPESKVGGISENKLQLYPNPSRNQISVTYQSQSKNHQSQDQSKNKGQNVSQDQGQNLSQAEESTQVLIHINDLLGREWIKEKRTIVKGENAISIDLTGLVSGQYWLEIVEGEKRSASPFQIIAN